MVSFYSLGFISISEFFILNDKGFYCYEEKLLLILDFFFFGKWNNGV